MHKEQKDIFLNGFVSTSQKEEKAMEFAMKGADPKNDKYAVLYEIQFCDKSHYFSMNDPRFSAYYFE